MGHDKVANLPELRTWKTLDTTGFAINILDMIDELCLYLFVFIILLKIFQCLFVCCLILLLIIIFAAL